MHFLFADHKEDFVANCLHDIVGVLGFDGGEDEFEDHELVVLLTIGIRDVVAANYLDELLFCLFDLLCPCFGLLEVELRH